MLSMDTNILFHALNEDSPSHKAAYAWLTSIQDQDDVAISEFILAELYGLLRNPAVLKHPLDAEEAVEVIQTYRRHPRWRLIGFTVDSRPLHDALWQKARRKDFAFRRLYDARSALTMTAQGVTEFATVNVKDYEGLGFRKVWNPLAQ
ncbi:MAG: PIN domain-containing protein [Verrucomicrobia bacterium]|jgi:toxin-antitoxin system PIN domain toxin|nr:PIN domain-containing protein [Verrucomicrobiota bacterium]